MPARKPKEVIKRVKALAAKPIKSSQAVRVKGGGEIRGDKADLKTGVANITKKA